MYVVERVARGHRYLYLVESVREGKTVRQRTIKALGRKDVLAASGELDRLAASIARHAQRGIILSDIDAGRIAARRIGGPLLFRRHCSTWVKLINRSTFGKRSEKLPVDQLALTLEDQDVALGEADGLQDKAAEEAGRYGLRPRRRRARIAAGPSAAL